MKMRRLSAARGRAPIIWGAAAFLVFQLVLNLALERWQPVWRDPEHSFKLRRLRAAQAESPDAPLALFVGSSRTLFGLHPDMLHSPRWKEAGMPVVFNYGITAQGTPLHELLCLRRLLAAGIRPTWVFVEIMPACLDNPSPEQDPHVINHLARKELPLISGYWPHPFSLYRQWAVPRLVPWYSYRFSVMSALAPRWLPGIARQDFFWHDLDKLGCLMLSKDPSSSERTRMLNEARAEYAARLGRLEISPSSDRALRDLADVCRERGIRLAFYFMPEGKEFQSWYSPSARARVDDNVAAIARQCGVPLVDCRDWMVDADFYDSHHLSPRGSVAFSKRFGRDVFPNLLGPQSPSKASFAAAVGNPD